MEFPNQQTRSIDVSLPMKHWKEIEEYADDNNLTVGAAASDILLCAVGEWLSQADYISYLMSQQGTSNEPT